MKKNMGTLDRVIRLLIAAVIAGLVYFKIISGTLSMVLLVAALIFALTSFLSFCPMYKLIGVNTCEIKK